MSCWPSVTKCNAVLTETLLARSVSLSVGTVRKRYFSVTIRQDLSRVYKAIEASDLKSRNSIKSNIFSIYYLAILRRYFFGRFKFFFISFECDAMKRITGLTRLLLAWDEMSVWWMVSQLTVWAFVLVHRSESVVCISLALVVCVCRSHSFALCLCISFTSASATYVERRPLFAPFVSFAPFVQIVCIDRGPTCVDLGRRSLLAGKLLHVGRYWCGYDYNVATSRDFIQDFAHLH